MSRGWEVARLDGLEALPGPGTLRWTPVRRRFGLTAFGINAYVAAEAGQDVVEEHTEESLGHEEVYAVVAGRAAFLLDGERVEAPAGSIVVVRDPAVRRAATALEPGTTVLAVGGRPGAHEPSPWETVFAAYGRADEGDLDGGLAELDAALAQREGSAALRYHRACLLARTGRLQEAEAELRRAVELRPELRERAEGDSDLAAVVGRL